MMKLFLVIQLENELLRVNNQLGQKRNNQDIIIFVSLSIELLKGSNNDDC